MKPPVESGYTSEGVPAREQVLLINQLRTAANRVYQRKVVAHTSGNGQTGPVWTDPDEMPHNTHASLAVYAIASGIGPTIYGMWERRAFYFRAADLSAGVVQLGAVLDVHPPVVSHSAMQLAFALSNNHLSILASDVNSGGGQDAVLDWDLWIEVRSG
jgi:hypothetical protein